MSVPDNGWMRPKQVAAYLNISVETLKRMRQRRSGPVFYKHCGVQYKRADLDKWLEEHRNSR